MKKLEGKKISLRGVGIKDAEFILELRQDKKLNRYISSTSPNLYNQKEWIQNYLLREKLAQEFYFIVEDTYSHEKYGTVRIYNIQNSEATWGSFMLSSRRPSGAAYEVIDLSLEFAFNNLKLTKILLEVVKENLRAIHIYEKSGFQKTDEDSVNYYYEITSPMFQLRKKT